jgi:hypothetical protein
VTLSAYEKQERAANAKALINDPLFKEVLDGMTQEYLTELIQTDIGGLTAVQLHANIRAVEAIRSRLQSFITEERFLARKGR